MMTGRVATSLAVIIFSPLLAAAIRLSTVIAAEWYPSPISLWCAQVSLVPTALLGTTGAAIGGFIADGPLGLRVFCSVFSGGFGFAAFWMLSLIGGA